MAKGKTNTVIGTTIGTAENPYIASTEAKMAQYLADSTKAGSFVQYTGTSGTYVQNEVYRILESGDITQYMPISTTLKKLLDTTKSAAHLFSGYQGTNVNGLITYNDTSSVINMDSMFDSCSSLTTIPQLDTSKVSTMSFIFYNCSKLTTIPQLDTSNVTNMTGVFYNCSKLTTIPQLDTSSVINMDSMFENCSSLTTIPQLDASKVSITRSMFAQCSNLKSILMTGMKVDFDISSSTQFEKSDLVTILNNLATVTSTKTLTMGATNLAKLTDEDKAIATNKGWTLA